MNPRKPTRRYCYVVAVEVEQEPDVFVTARVLDVGGVNVGGIEIHRHESPGVADYTALADVIAQDVAAKNAALGSPA